MRPSSPSIESTVALEFDLRLDAVHAYQPLHERVPIRDAQGALLTDFMLLFPGLREQPRLVLSEILARIQTVLGEFREVVFADLNLPLNLLWVSVRPKPGIVIDVATAMKLFVPETLLVGQQPPG